MRLLKNILLRLWKVSVLGCFLLGIGICDVYAFETPFVVDTICESKKNELKEFYDIKPISQNNVSGEKIRCFSVSSDGEKICVGFANDKVAVYSCDGKFLYGFSYFDYGGICCLFDEADQDLVIYSIRNKNLIKIQSNGIVSEMAIVTDAKENDMVKTKLLLYDKEMHGKKYFLKFSKLSIIDDGKEKVLIDHSREVSFQGVIYIILIVFLSLVGMLMNKEYRKKS